MYKIIKLTAKHAKFLCPQLIEQLVIDNNIHFKEWSEKLSDKNINPSIYLWENSPCAFPGVRRYSGNKELAYFKKHKAMETSEISDACVLDDNDFPKQIWSFVFRDRQFAKSGPEGFALAHLADHKTYKNRMYKEFKTESNKTPLYGLFTCPTNTAFIPTSLLRPTDFSLIIRKILIEKANNLYGNVCNILPIHLSMLENMESKYSFLDFEWADTVGKNKSIKDFLEFRLHKLCEILK